MYGSIYLYIYINIYSVYVYICQQLINYQQEDIFDLLMEASKTKTNQHKFHFYLTFIYAKFKGMLPTIDNNILIAE